MRIVSLCPSNTELLAYLDATHLLVGVDNYSDWPLDILHLPKLGPDLDIDIEKVQQLNPDLVLASLSVPGMERNIEALEKTELKYVSFNPQSFSDLFEDLLLLGDLIGQKQKAIEVITSLKEKLDFYKDHFTTSSSPPVLYWEWWPKPVFTPGSVNWLTEMSHLVGAVNCFEDHPEANVQTTWDDVLSRDPDHICMVWVGVDHKKVKKEFILKRQGAHHLQAVKTDRIHVLPESLFCRPSPRLFEGLELLKQLLHG